MNRLCKRLLKTILEEYETYESFCEEYGVSMDLILELKNGDQAAYGAAGKLVYGEGFVWKEMEHPVEVGYRRILGVSDGVYRVELEDGGVVEVDRGSVNLDRFNCRIYVEKGYGF